MRTLRRLRTVAARRVRRNAFDLTDATMEPDPGPPPEAVFDRTTGPFGNRHSAALPGAFDEET